MNDLDKAISSILKGVHKKDILNRKIKCKKCGFPVSSVAGFRMCKRCNYSEVD
jgi:predicted nucleic-acid-binding Zn-ribbon protein